MSDLRPSIPKRRRITSSGRREDVYSTPTFHSDADGEPPARPFSLSSTGLPHKGVADSALLHLLDGYYIKRHTIEPWNTSGGFCDVFTGDHPVFGKVALKRPRTSGDRSTQSQVRSFISEGQLWRELRHPNVLQFVGMIASDSQVWLISVFATNGTLNEYILKYPQADRHNLVFQLTSGLDYLHSKDVVHGDLKSPNLLISANRELLISDFGLSKITGTNTATSKKGAGSTHWMAPELIFKNDSTKTFASDMYAYGLVISEILRGEIPFKECGNHAAVIMAISEKKRPPTVPRESLQGKSYALLWAVAEDCWNAKPSERPSTVDVCNRLSLKSTRAKGDTILSPETESGIGSVRSELTPMSGGTNFISLSVNITTPSNNAADTPLLQLLGSAEYGDIEPLNDGGLCLDGTRVEVLERLDTWTDQDSSPRIMLLRGQAGRGKSTIARTASSRFRNHRGDNSSSAIFHFRRDDEALNNRPLCALARQLGCCGDRRVRAAILKSLQDHQDIAQLSLEAQFEILLVDSLKELEPNPPRILLVMDALDECSDHTFISTLLHLIRKYDMSLPSTVKFLLTSRPDAHILNAVNDSFDGIQEDLDTVDGGIIDRDVRAYFVARLSEIRRDFAFDAAWASREVIDQLVTLSQGLFQWAHAAMEYIREQPRLRLDRLVQSPNVVVGLPELYRQILSSAFPTREDAEDDGYFLALVQHVIGSLVVAHHPMSTSILEYLWVHHPDGLSSSYPAIEIRERVLGRLGSILVLPSSPDGSIHFIHTTVRDFLTNPAQCKDNRFLIDPSAHHARLAAICFDGMKKDLRHDICGINDPSKMNSEVFDLIEQRIPFSLRYCCYFWSTHLSETKDDVNASVSVRDKLEEFCRKRMLQWLEIMSLVGSLSKVFDMIRRTKGWLENMSTPQGPVETLTIALLSDTDNFCRRFFQPISTNAQHIVLSALLHFPNETALRDMYATSIGHPVPRVIRGPALRRSDWSRTIHARCMVRCVALSPDGRTLAASSDGGTVQLWNMDTGKPKGKPFIGHGKAVWSVAFSPDGNTLASGSQDATIRLWAVNTREPKGNTLRGHEAMIWSVAFSADGKVLASGSIDKTIRLWSVDTGEAKGGPLVGHTGCVRGIAFSPDGEILASGSDDGTIRLWNIHNGQSMGEPLVGSFGSVGDVTFSPDGRTLASGSGDGKIWLWAVNTRKPKGGPLAGHTERIWSVTFSPDGKILASGSADKTIRLWSVDTKEQRGEPFVGHTARVMTVAFCHDGKTLASGSEDGRIRLWAINTGESKGETPLSHREPQIINIAFSPDGESLASGLDDGTIRLWRMDTGERMGKPLVGHKDCVCCIAFSPDGKTLASGSKDKTIRLWVVDTAEQKGRPLVGHAGSVKSISFTPDGNSLISRSLKKSFSWMLGDGHPKKPNTYTQQDAPISGLQHKLRIMRPSALSSDANEQGWVFLDGQRCFWLPEQFYLDGRTSNMMKITLSGKYLVLHHSTIHILDISAFLQ